MKLFVGLGNPEVRYTNTRHNVGYLFCDYVVAKKLRIKNSIIKKSGSFMNDSGTWVRQLLGKFNIDPKTLYIIHDDLDLPLASWKIQYAKGPKDNGGINSIEQILGTDEFWRIRVGIDNRNPETTGPKLPKGEDYVLQDFSPGERKIIDGVFDQICKKLETL